MRHMRRGDFSAAWSVSDMVLRERLGQGHDQLPPQFPSVWNGDSLVGQRVLIRCYHGLGDTIQFIRYAPLVKQIAARVIVCAPAALLPLLATVSGIDELLPLDAGAPDIDYDIDVEVMELPHVFRSTIETVPADVPYLHVAPRDRRDDGNFHLGLVWKCSSWAPERSIPINVFRPLAKIPGVTLHVLQRGAGLDERPPGFGVVSGSDDVMAAARVIASLDLMLSIDSMPAHLAGALAVPTWTLLPAKANWRWMDERSDTPWYPTMRLFRQRIAGDWQSLLAVVAAKLSSMANARTRGVELAVS